MKDNYTISEAFKMTELGALPETWEVVKLGDFLDVLRNGTTKKQNKDGKGYPVSRIETISTGVIDPSKVGFVEDLTDEQIGNYQLKEGDILLSHINSEPYLGNSAIFKNNLPVLIHGMNLLMLRTKTALLDSEFLNYLFNSYRSKGIFIGIASRAVNQSSINQGRLKSLSIPLPPLLEQKKIAAVLSAVQETKKKTETVIEAARELKKSLMKYLFTYGPVRTEEAENVSQKETEIGLIPEGWEVVRLRDIIKKTEQKDPRKNPKSEFKYIDVSSINRENVKIIDYKLYQGKNGPSRARKLVKNEDVIFATVRPTLKRMALINEKFDGEICSTAFCVLRAKENILKPLYLFYGVGRNVFIDELGKMQRGASYPAVKDSDVKNQRIPLPSLCIQQRIAEILSTVDEKIEAEENKKKALEELFKSLLNNLMTAKIRVNHLEIAL